VSRRFSIPWRTLVLAVAALAVAAAPGASALLALDRDALAAGQIWRALSGHLVHATGYHLLWNVLALVGLGFLFEPALRFRMWSLVLVSATAVTVGVLWLAPSLQLYRGLSGMLNGIWVGGALWCARRDGDRLMPGLYRICVVAALAKIGVEAWLGAPILTDATALGGQPVPLAHALGALGGMAWLFGGDAIRARRTSIELN
jgi:rhomboid family GlyGly-CTERM serine protease